VYNNCDDFPLVGRGKNASCYKREIFNRVKGCRRKQGGTDLLTINIEQNNESFQKYKITNHARKSPLENSLITISAIIILLVI
jgi:hypothetical protein